MQKESLLTAQVDVFRRSPSANTYLLFNYSHPVDTPCGVAIGESNNVPEGRYKHYAGRAARSGGLLQVHFMQILDGGSRTLWIFPLRSASSDLFVGAQRIAAETRPGKRVDTARIKGLLALDVTEIH